MASDSQRNTARRRAELMEERRAASGSSSRSRNNLRSSGSRTGSSSRTGRSSSSDNGKYRPTRNTQRNKKRNDERIIAYTVMGLVIVAILIIATLGIRSLMGRGKKSSVANSESIETSSVLSVGLDRAVTVEDVNIEGMTIDEAKDAIIKKYPWKMTAKLAGASSGTEKLKAGSTNATTGAAQTGDGSSDLVEDADTATTKAGAQALPDEESITTNMIKVEDAGKIDYSAESFQIAESGSSSAAESAPSSEKASQESAASAEENTVEDEETYLISNIFDAQIDKVLADVYSGANTETYITVKGDDVSEAIAAEVTAISEKWNVTARNGAVSGFDKATNSFVYKDAIEGRMIDTEKLTTDIKQAVSEADFTKTITVNFSVIEPELTKAEAKAKYKVIGTFSTKTTSNADRNNNIRLACEAIDGTILQSGEEFSFNTTTGNRTAEKGYKLAGAYVNGEVALEPGGGVCQVSSTLYNAVIFSGMTTVERHAHTFEPSYVSPGEDAMVSYDGYAGPDMRFVNSSESAIAIRAHYADQTVSMSIVGIPILQNGVTISLKSQKTKEYDNSSVEYEEDPTMPLGEEKIVSQGTKGSLWVTNIITKQDGKELSNVFFHNSTYKGHAQKIKRNTGVAPSTSVGDISSDAESILTDENGETIISSPTAASDGIMATDPAPDGTTAEQGPGVTKEQTKSQQTKASTKAESTTKAPAITDAATATETTSASKAETSAQSSSAAEPTVAPDIETVAPPPTVS